ncbi:MAG: 30S ribosomal protein S1, partial [Planctomycetales bacterium]
MVNRNLIRQYDVDEDQIELDFDLEEIDWEANTFSLNDILEGKIIRIEADLAVVDVGNTSEGMIPLNEWGDGEDPPKQGDLVKVLLEEVEDAGGLVRLSKRKAEKIEAWNRVMETVREEDVVTGPVTRKIKGGLLVDIGVNVFLPASQVDIRRPSDIGDYINRTVQCLVLKIDETRRNIVVSRRALIESERAERKSRLLKKLEVGQTRRGVVKNIADFGAFVDLGGIDGLLHITDMSWGRISHPSEMVSLDQEIEVMILNIDREKEKIALGLKQKTPSPWENIEEKYPVDSRAHGKVVNVMSYGAFVKLEDGIEGLVHISEMSWTKRISHPSEMVAIGDDRDVVVLGINKEKQEISLGMKQTETNPWDEFADRYPPGTKVQGIARNLTNYGAFIEIEEGIDGLLHVSDMSWTRKISHPNEMVEKSQQVDCVVLSVDKDRRRIALGLKQLEEDPWEDYIPSKYQPGMTVLGKVTKLTNFGVFVGVEDGLEGLLHISELADHKVDNPEEIVKVGEEIEVKILRVDTQERKIGLSRKRVEWAEEAEGTEGAEGAAKVAGDTGLKGGIGDSSGPLIPQTPQPKPEAAAAEVTSEEAATEEAASEEAATEEAATEEAATEEAVSEEVASEEAASEEAVSEEAASEET